VIHHHESVTALLSASYRARFEALHAEVALMDLGETDLTSFWPMIGAAYDGELLVVGRAVNGWRTQWTVDQARSAAELAAVVSDAIATNTVTPDPMDWIVRLWGNAGERFDGFAMSRYNTARSAFWRVCRELCVVSPWHRPPEAWSSYIAWSNLYKVAPFERWNPAGALLASQRKSAARLLANEVDELDPRHVVALTGREWFEPFAEHLGLDVAWQRGLVEGVARSARRRWVIAKHPMGKPGDAWLDEVRAALR
jgi:hypothetical protein